MAWRIKEGFRIMQGGVMQEAGAIVETLETELRHMAEWVDKNVIEPAITEVEQVVEKAEELIEKKKPGRKPKNEKPQEPEPEAPVNEPENPITESEPENPEKADELSDLEI